MTNTEIIISESVEHGIYTQEQIDEFLAIGQLPPIHTYGEWQYLGYRPRKGEHGISTKLWKLVPQKKDSEKTDVEESHFILTKAYLFSAEQVERVLEVTE